MFKANRAQMTIDINQFGGTCEVYSTKEVARYRLRKKKDNIIRIAELVLILIMLLEFAWVGMIHINNDIQTSIRKSHNVKATSNINIKNPNNR